MPPSVDRARIRAVLNRDRPWALYALGDLSPELFSRGRWWCDGDAVALLFDGFDPPILLAVGSRDDVRPLLNEMPRPPTMYLHVQPEIASLLDERYAVPEPRQMIRMALAARNYRPATGGTVQRISRADAAALAALYRDGDANHEAPGFFAPEMIDQGVYFGVREGGDLIAAAGTHLVSITDSVAAIGNVYTRRDRRARGLGALTTTAVASDLLDKGIRTVALSVNERNTGAIRVYERLGFREHCRFVEGIATRVSKRES